MKENRFQTLRPLILTIAIALTWPADLEALASSLKKPLTIFLALAYFGALTAPASFGVDSPWKSTSLTNI